MAAVITAPVLSNPAQGGDRFASLTSGYEGFVARLVNDPEIQKNAQELWTIGAFAGVGGAAATFLGPEATIPGMYLGARVGAATIHAIHVAGMINDCLQHNNRCIPDVAGYSSEKTLDWMFEARKLGTPPGLTQSVDLVWSAGGDALAEFYGGK